MAKGTSNNPENDQITRGMRTLALSTGSDSPSQLFEISKRQIYWIALTREPIERPTNFSQTNSEHSTFGTLSWNDIRLSLLDLANELAYQQCRDLQDYLFKKLNGLS